MRPKHLFSCDGALYDTRDPEWSRKRPLRPVYCRPAWDICDTADLRAALRSGPYAWPGGYPLYFITSDGAALSFESVRDQLRNVTDAIWRGCDDGWRAVGVQTNWEDSDLTCDHSGERIPSAYGD